MISAITNSASAPPAAPATNKSSTQAPQSRQSSGGSVTDTVHLSSTAQAQLSAGQSAMQEATETSAQTAKEAMGGDTQAQRLLAREAQAEAQR